MTRMDLFGILPLEDLVYRAWVAEQCRLGIERCVVCGMPGVGHHVRNKGVYGDRKNIAVLCEGFVTGHHTRAQYSVHQMGRWSFEKKFRHEIPDGLQGAADRLDAKYVSETSTEGEDSASIGTDSQREHGPDDGDRQGQAGHEAAGARFRRGCDSGSA